MRRYNFLFVIGLILTLGLATAFAGGKDDKKRPKNTGILTVKTSPDAYQVKVNGEVIGMSGVNTPAEFYLAPGFHNIEIVGPNGMSFSDDVEIVKNKKNCICLKMVERVTTKACPYRVNLSGPDQVLDGDLITFVSTDALNSPTPLNYNWTVTGGRITSGQGRQAITVDTAGMGGQTVSANLDVNDGVYDEQCRQNINVATFVENPPPPPSPRKFDEFVSRAFDDDKARLDSFAIELQTNPDTQGYIIMYQGTEKGSRDVEKISKRALDYLVNSRGIDPRRIVFTNWGTRQETTYELWVIPPGAQPPVPE